MPEKEAWGEFVCQLKYLNFFCARCMHLSRAAAHIFLSRLIG